jgi:hypothetical protein
VEAPAKPWLAVDQVLVNRYGVTFEVQSRLDKRAVWLAKGSGRSGRRRRYSRWPGWGSLPGQKWESLGGRRGTAVAAALTAAGSARRTARATEFLRRDARESVAGLGHPR